MKLVSVAEMKALEEQANKEGVSNEQLMQNAGVGIARYILNHASGEKKIITGLVGSGNNGGDTLIALAALAKSGWQARAYLVRPRPEQDAALKWLQQAGGSYSEAEKDEKCKMLKAWLADSGILLDGVLGTGAKLPLKAEISHVLKLVRTSSNLPYVIAVDCPSGVDCESGEAAGECIPADLTICLEAVKQGLMKFPARGFTGKLEVVEIGLPAKVKNSLKIPREVADRSMVKHALPHRAMDAHKGTFGTALIIAGSVNFTGAALLAGKGAYRMGCGLVRLGVIQNLHDCLAGQIPQATWLILPSEEGVIRADAAEIVLENLDRVSAMVLGPGMGGEEPTQKFLERLLERKAVKKMKAIGFVPEDESEGKGRSHNLPPMVIDADALRMLIKIPDWQKKIPAESVLTPHPGEMAAMTGMTVEEIQANREGAARNFAMRWKQVVVLKGALTVIAVPDGRTVIIPAATSALAKAGTGDILAGMICGLRAQGVDGFQAAIAGAWLHGRAGELAAEKTGSEMTVSAEDILEGIPPAVRELDLSTKKFG